jgi:hypothetical protein
MSDDKLQNHRDASKRDSKVFVNWLQTNCVHAVPIEQVREITKDVKEKSVYKAVEDE